MRKKASMRLLGLFILCLLAVGCAPRQFFYLNPQFHEVDLGRVCVLPVVDRRMDKSPDIDLNAAMQERIFNKVVKKGYDVSTALTFSEAGDVTADAVALMSQQDICNLGPADATSLLVVYVKEARGFYSVMEYSFRVSAEAELIHKPSKTMLWKAYGAGHHEQGGLISGLLVPIVRRNALHWCVDNTMKSLPKITSTNRSKSVDHQLQTPPPSAIPSATLPAPSSPPPQPQEPTEQASDDRGIISITSDPPGAKVFIDGEFKGQTPAEISLNCGTYQLFLEHQLYEPYKDSIMIEKGQSKTLDIKLSPAEKE